MGLKLISPGKEKWNEFVDSNTHSTVFQKYEMADAYSSAGNRSGIRLAVSNEEEKLLACMLVKIESKKFLKSLTSIAIIENAPLYEDSEHGREAAEFIIKHYDKYIRRKALYSSAKVDNDSFLEWLYESEGYSRTATLNFEISLDKDPDAVFMAIHKSRRKNIKKAAKNLEIIESGRSSLPGFYKLIKETYDKVGVLIPDISFFNAVFDLMPENAKLFLAMHEGKCIAGRIILLHKKKMFDFYAGASSDHLNLFPNDALVWHVLEYGCKNGYEIFDFQGAGVPGEEYGVREFKKRFGGKLVNSSCFKKIHRPLMASLGAKLFSAYRKAFEQGSKPSSGESANEQTKKEI